MDESISHTKGEYISETFNHWSFFSSYLLYQYIHGQLKLENILCRDDMEIFQAFFSTCEKIPFNRKLQKPAFTVTLLFSM